MFKIVSTMPYEQISFVKIFWDGEDFCIDFILGDISHLYVVKKDKWETIAFGEAPISHHIETDFFFTEGGAESFRERFEIDELLAVSEFHHACNWRTNDYGMLKIYEPFYNESDYWIDPAGGVHSCDEKDPAKMYE